MKIQRREFIMGLAGAAAAPATAARAQQAKKMPVVGYLSFSARAPHEHFTAAFRKGLSQAGFFEGSNVAIKYRFADRDIGQLPGLAADLLHRGAKVIMASTLQAAHKAKEATATVPVVFRAGSNAVKEGLVASFEHPGGNVTGVNDYGFDLWPKRLGLLRYLLPNAKHIAVLLQGNSDADAVTAAANAVGLSVDINTTVTSEGKIDKAFADIAQKPPDAVVVSQTLLFEDRRVQMVTLAMYYRLPAFFSERSFCEAGGLASYGSDFEDQERLAGIYVGRILKGEKPADMRVLRPKKTEFVINHQTARTLGITVPPALLALADAVIE
jgi:putative tryptophan/tyrosine transport system substrate-binding protein